MSNPGYVTSNEFPSFQGVYLGRYDTGLMSKAAADQVAVKDAVAAAVKAALDKQKSTSAPWPEVKVTANGDGVTFIVGKTGSATVKIRARDVASMTVAPKREGGKLKVVYGVATPYTPRAHARHFLSILRCVVVQHSVNISLCGILARRRSGEVGPAGLVCHVWRPNTAQMIAEFYNDFQRVTQTKADAHKDPFLKKKESSHDEQHELIVSKPLTLNDATSKKQAVDHTSKENHYPGRPAVLTKQLSATGTDLLAFFEASAIDRLEEAFKQNTALVTCSVSKMEADSDVECDFSDSASEASPNKCDSADLTESLSAKLTTMDRHGLAAFNALAL